MTTTEREEIRKRPGSSPGPILRLALVDGSPGVHSAIRQATDIVANRWRLTTYLNATEALKRMPLAPPDIVLIQLGVPAHYGINCIRKFKTVFPALPVLVLTVRPEGSNIRESLLAGAGGCLALPANPKTIVHAVTQTVQGWPVLCPKTLKAVLAASPSTGTGNGEVRLTPRQRQILILLSQNLSDKEIARSIGVSSSTIHGHTASLFKKLGINSREEARGVAAFGDFM